MYVVIDAYIALGKHSRDVNMRADFTALDGDIQAVSIHISVGSVPDFRTAQLRAYIRNRRSRTVTTESLVNACPKVKLLTTEWQRLY